MVVEAFFATGTEKMEKAFVEISALCDGFFEIACAENEKEHCKLFKLYDTAITQRAVLSSMLCSAKALGTHGSALVDRAPDKTDSPRKTRTVTKGAVSYIEPISSMPDPELWFEKLLARKYR